MSAYKPNRDEKKCSGVGVTPYMIAFIVFCSIFCDNKLNLKIIAWLPE
jgi:hypothetical protein